jgi:hypothetical protein
VLAHYTEDTWFGPMILAGGDGTAALNPEMLIFRHSAEIQVEGEEQPRFFEDTFVHIAWWGFSGTPNEGSAYYIGLPLDEQGMPDFNAFEPQPVCPSASTARWGVKPLPCSTLGSSWTRRAATRTSSPPTWGSACSRSSS